MDESEINDVAKHGCLLRSTGVGWLFNLSVETPGAGKEIHVEHCAAEKSHSVNLLPQSPA